MLSKLLTEWAPRPGFQSWNRATSSTVIMKTVFTDARFYSCCKNYLYLWTHMATKSMCEAVVEGMGGVWDRCDRQGNWVTATEEAVIAWNAPQPYHPASGRRALHQPCARELGRAQLGRPLSPQRQVTCTEGRHWSFAAAGSGHDAEEGRDTASARRVLRRQASFEAAWPQLTATDCLHVSRLYRYRGALRAHRCQRAPRGI